MLRYLHVQRAETCALSRCVWCAVGCHYQQFLLLGSNSHFFSNFFILFILIYHLIIFDKSRQFLPRPGLAGGYVDPHVFVHQSPY